MPIGHFLNRVGGAPPEGGTPDPLLVGPGQTPPRLQKKPETNTMIPHSPLVGVVVKQLPLTCLQPSSFQPWPLSLRESSGQATEDDSSISKPGTIIDSNEENRAHYSFADGSFWSWHLIHWEGHRKPESLGTFWSDRTLTTKCPLWYHADLRIRPGGVGL